MRVKWLRRFVQLATLVLFVVLLLGTRWRPGGAHPAHPLLLRVDPLSMLLTALSPAHRFLPFFLPALILLVLTVVFGRFFCGWLCPLGTTIDIAETLFWRRRPPQREAANRPALKYYVLAASLVAALFGTQIAWLADPIPLLTRTATTVFLPIGHVVYNFLVISGRPVLRALHVRAYPSAVHEFSLNLAVAAFFAVVIGLSYFSRRFWCRSVCPLGALFALLARWGLWRRWVTGCVECKACLRNCKMGAIPADNPSDTRAGECILCYDCITCPRPGIVHMGLAARTPGHLTSTGTDRRAFLASAGLGLAYGATAATGLTRRPLRDDLLRPPGAIKRGPGGIIRQLTEEEFRAACVRCGNCMKACVTGGLQPAVLQAGLEGLYTPVLVPTVGYCEQNCNACGDVCPSGALQHFDVAEKAHIQIGRAWVDRSRCLSWRPGDLYKLCLICDEHCPWDAIEVIVDQGQKRPVVNEDKCVGCGQCENRCPVTPERAIKVQRKGPQR
ncbi:MAG: 4Fe-4S binding protein [Armatimonadetes bacterium]|nr:4Fe-4S binding protein [Armatimonadota bacterium]